MDSLRASIPQANTFLDIRNVEEVVGRVLLCHMALAFQVRTPYRSLDELKAQPSRFQDDYGTGAPDLAQVGEDTYAWYRFDDRVDDGVMILRPSDVAKGDAGRWVRQKLPYYAACGTPTFFKWIEFSEPGLSLKEMWDRARGNAPMLYLSCLWDEVVNVSQTRAYHFYEIRYRLRVLSAHFRGGLGARFGSPVQLEKEEDPGTAKLLGWLRWYLVGENRLGPTLGISEVELGPRVPDLSRAADRIVSDYAEITVRGSVYTPNEPCDLITPHEVWMKLQDAEEENRGMEGHVTLLHEREEEG